MRDIQNKTDGTGDILTAEAFNANYIEELQRIAETADFTLDVEAGPDTDLHMFTKSIVIYASASNYYDDTGAINAFVLDRSNNLEPFPSYVDGMLLTFKASTTNTGACTVNVDSLGVKSLTDSAGSVLSPGDITVNNYITIRYDSGNDRFETVVTPVIGGGGGLTSWEENGTTFRPTSSGYDIGDSTHLVGDFYIGNLNYIMAEDFGGTLRAVLGIDGSSVFQIGNTNIATNIQSNGTLTHNTVDMITDLLPAQATHAGEYLQTDGAGTLSWAAVGAGGLTNWEESVDIFRPVTTKTGQLGDATHLIEQLYLMTDGYAYFGDTQQGSIRYFSGGTTLYISSSANMDLDAGTDLSIAVSGDQYFDITGDTFFNTNPASNVYFQFSSTTHWQLSNTGPILPGASNPSADIGSTTAEIENIYISDTGAIYFGSDQDMSINHDGSNGYINISTGALRINGCDVSIDNLLAYQCENNVGTAFDMALIDGSNVAQIANTSLATNIRSNGTLTHNTVDLITDLLPAQATHSGEFLQTDGAGTLSWAAAGGALSAWEENSNDLRPVTTKVSNLGDPTHLIVNAYFGDSGTIFFGDGQDMSAYHDGLDGYINVDTGSFEINVPTSELIYLSIAGTTRWQVDASGNLTPFATSSYALGSTSLRVDKGWFDDLEITNTPTINGSSFINTVLPAQSTHQGEFLTNDGAGTLSWAAARITNILINPLFEINQRGWSSGSNLASIGDYFVDRWCAATANTAPTLSGYVLTIPSGDSVKQIVAAGNIPNGTYTISWTGTSTVSIDGGASQSSPHTFTVSSSSDVEIEFEPGTLSYPVLVEGSVPMPFSKRHAETEIALCERYYQKSYNLAVAPGTASNSPGYITELSTRNNAGFTGGIRFTTRMRAAPTVTIYSPLSGTSGVADAGGVERAASASTPGQSGILAVQLTGSATSEGINWHYVADAEL